MRQWDNSWNHNGMSFFLAEIPQSVQFYHGTSQEEAVTGMEWLAFEPEHALMFAWGRPVGRPEERRRGKHEGPPPSTERENDGSSEHHRWSGLPPSDFFDDYSDHHSRDKHPAPLPSVPDHELDRDQVPSISAPPPDHHHKRRSSPGPAPRYHDEQRILAETPRPSPNVSFNSTGFLHFYRTLHPLTLLYIDGLSAGKTTKGTLDSQDYILRLGLNNTPITPFGDLSRAQALCNVSRDAWDNKIDGFMRMECGFEVILCNFSAHLQLERTQAVKNDNSSMNPWHDFRLYRAVADRFYGIGGDRVYVDFANMVTAFAGDLHLFTNDTPVPNELLPRLQHQSTSHLTVLQDTVTEMVMAPAPKATVNWQSIAEMFVQRYATPLQYLLLPSLSIADFQIELKALLRPFISDETDDAELATQRCIEQFLPPTWQDILAGQVVQQVSHKICLTLITSLLNVTFSINDSAHNSARNAINELVNYLDWPVWRECNPGCAVNELCVLPIWPMTANIEDRKQPRCKNATAFREGEAGRRSRDKNYWMAPAA